MPSLGADMDSGTVLEWLVHPGDDVRRGDVVAVVDTDKAAVDVECFDTGRIGEILVPTGRRVAVGTPLATILAAGEAEVPAPRPGPATVPPPYEPAAAPPPEPATVPPPPQPVAAAAASPLPAPEPAGASPPPAAAAVPPEPAPVPQPEPAAAPPPAAPPPVPATALPPAAAVPPPPAAGSRPKAPPPARSFAARSGVNLAEVRGTGRGGTITHADVQRAIDARHAPSRRRVTPYARRLATELHVDLAAVPGDPVRARDVRAAAGTAAPARKRDETAARRAIGDLMARSKRDIPHYYVSATIDMHAALSWLTERNRAAAVADRIVPAALLLKATAVAAGSVPRVNGHFTDGAFHPAEQVNLGVAVSLRGGGLLTPVIADAAQLTLPALMRTLRDLTTRARTGRLRSSELGTATITVTNLGDLGVDSVLGVIFPPQVALVGFGAIADRPWAVDGMLGVRPLVTATLSADHRAGDGADGARLLNTIATLLNRPETL
ncbi:dihydrolipoamide acetyltransferase family protein [Amycolatopsis thermoflava]|uniref:dihydrolipoamide acetyltransferase family protein n=1 Tax=Amycolatopsis thermoflava TaxID=84480 RepID=UPI0037F46901